MDVTSATRTPRNDLVKLRSSFELRVQPTSTQKQTIFLSAPSSCTLMMVVAMLYTNAWLLSMGVCSTCLVAFLMESAQDSTLLLYRGQQVLEDTLQELRRETNVAKQDLEFVVTSCLLEDSSYSNLLSSLDENTSSDRLL